MVDKSTECIVMSYRVNPKPHYSLASAQTPRPAHEESSAMEGPCVAKSLVRFASKHSKPEIFPQKKKDKEKKFGDVACRSDGN